LQQRSHVNITPSGAVYYQIVKAENPRERFRNALFKQNRIVFDSQRFPNGIWLLNCYLL